MVCYLFPSYVMPDSTWSVEMNRKNMEREAYPHDVPSHAITVMKPVNADIFQLE